MTRYGEAPNGWARKLVVSEGAREASMTAGERALFEEMARLRFIFRNGLKVLAAGELTTDGWRQALVESCIHVVYTSG